MKKTILVGALILVVASAAVAAAGPYGMRGACPLGAGPYASGSLNLTAEQAQKMMAIRQSNFSEMQEARNSLFQKRAELRLAWMQLEPDTAKIKVIQKEINDLMALHQEKMIEHRLALREILTPEQLTRHLASGSWSGGSKRGPGMTGRNFRSCSIGRGMGPAGLYGPGTWAAPPAVQ